MTHGIHFNGAHCADSGSFVYSAGAIESIVLSRLCIPHVRYEDGKLNFDDDVEPYTFEAIYAHIAQLAPVLAKNADVVYAVQAGFLGNAGEWAHDVRCLLKNATGLAQMVARELYGLLGAMPDRQVLLRKGDEKLSLLAVIPLVHVDEGPDARPTEQHGIILPGCNADIL